MAAVGSTTRCQGFNSSPRPVPLKPPNSLFRLCFSQVPAHVIVVVCCFLFLRKVDNSCLYL